MGQRSFLRPLCFRHGRKQFLTAAGSAGHLGAVSTSAELWSPVRCRRARRGVRRASDGVRRCGVLRRGGTVESTGPASGTRSLVLSRRHWSVCVLKGATGFASAFIRVRSAFGSFRTSEAVGRISGGKSVSLWPSSRDRALGRFSVCGSNTQPALRRIVVDGVNGGRWELVLAAPLKTGFSGGRGSCRAFIFCPVRLSGSFALPVFNGRLRQRAGGCPHRFVPF